MRPPAFQFYARDWLSSTHGMPWDVAGLYIHLLAWSWDNGPLPKSAIWRRRVIGPEAVRLWNVVKKRWKRTKDGWINERLERQRDGQIAFARRAEKGAKVRWQASVKHVLNRCSASASASADQDQPAAPVFFPFKVYAAIAKKAVAETITDDLGDVAEAFKKKCAQQGVPYDAAIVTKALSTATRRRA